MSFVHLHVHTQYSLLQGAIHMEALFDRVLQLGMSAVAITDKRLEGHNCRRIDRLPGSAELITHISALQKAHLTSGRYDVNVGVYCIPVELRTNGTNSLK